jgi:hypothetical protein
MERRLDSLPDLGRGDTGGAEHCTGAGLTHGLHIEQLVHVRADADDRPPRNQRLIHRGAAAIADYGDSALHQLIAWKVGRNEYVVRDLGWQRPPGSGCQDGRG